MPARPARKWGHDDTENDDSGRKMAAFATMAAWVHNMYLFESKKPSESKYPWDYYKEVATIPGIRHSSRCLLRRARW
jgi:hypothetical protein